MQRAMALHFPVAGDRAGGDFDSAELHRNADQFMFGNELLVAPQVNPGQGRSVYLPKPCSWVEFHTGRVVSPGRHWASSSLAHLFVPAGSVLLLGPDMPAHW